MGVSSINMRFLIDALVPILWCLYREVMCPLSSAIDCWCTPGCASQAVSCILAFLLLTSVTSGWWHPPFHILLRGADLRIIAQVVRVGEWVLLALMTAREKKRVVDGRSKKALGGFYTYPHHDANGYCTWVSIRCGAKIWGYPKGFFLNHQLLQTRTVQKVMRQLSVLMTPY